MMDLGGLFPQSRLFSNEALAFDPMTAATLDEQNKTNTAFQVQKNAERQAKNNAPPGR